MNYYETIIEMQDNGLCVFPNKNDKSPNLNSNNPSYSWTFYDGTFKKFDLDEKTLEQFEKVGLSCGKSSGGLEGIDVDSKYQVDRDLIGDIKAMVDDNCEGLWDKLTIIGTVNKGFHLLYFCENYDGNRKLALREGTSEEKNERYLELRATGTDKEKAKQTASRERRVLIETRGEGGYLCTYPSEGYTLLQGNITTIQTITDTERDILINSCILLDELLYEVDKVQKQESSQVTYKEGISPWEDYNQKISGQEMVDLFTKNGWVFNERLSNGSKAFLKRPGKTDAQQSGNIHLEKKIFVAHTSSTSFENGKGYPASVCYAILEHGGDLSLASKALLNEGYGEKPVKENSNSFDVFELDAKKFTAIDKADDFIMKYRNGDIELGLSLGYDLLDDYWMLKKNFNIFLGHANIGKSTWIWYVMTIANLLHGWRSIIYSTENSKGVVKMTICEFAVGKNIKYMTDFELKCAFKWFDDNFAVIESPKLLAYNQLLDVCESLMLEKKYDCVLIDPYNTLSYNFEKIDRRVGMHDYHHIVASEFKQWSMNNDIAVYLNLHAISEAMRSTHKSGDMKDYVTPPLASQAEGGGKWVSKADDFTVLHRYTNHPDKYTETIIDVQKVKEKFSGGQPMIKDNYFHAKLANIEGFYGFYDQFGNCPIRGIFKEKYLTQEQLELI